MIVGASFSFGFNFTKIIRACVRFVTNVSVLFIIIIFVGFVIFVVFFIVCICFVFVVCVLLLLMLYINNEFVFAYVIVRCV